MTWDNSLVKKEKKNDNPVVLHFNITNDKTRCRKFISLGSYIDTARRCAYNDILSITTCGRYERKTKKSVYKMSVIYFYLAYTYKFSYISM